MFDTIKRKPSIYSNSTYKTMRVIEELSKHVKDNGFIPLIKLSELVKQEKASVYRIINTLMEMGYLDKSGSKYKIGLKFLSITENIVHKYQFIDVARPLMQDLALSVHERAFISVIDKHEVVQIEITEGNPKFQIVSGVGTRFPLHAVASGKLFLSSMDEGDYKNYVKNTNFKSITKNTITNKKKLLGEIEVIQQRGYAVSNEEYEEHIRSIAVPIYSKQEKILAALGIAGTILTFTDDKIKNSIDLLKSTSKQITERLPG